MFRTEIDNIHLPFSISHQDQLMTLGSCFAEEIGQKLVSNKFKTQVNPFGTIFNPLSIFELISLAMEPTAIIEDAMLERDGLYYNYKFHSSYRSETKSGLLKMIQDQLEQTRKQLTKTKVLFLTFGTAWAYQAKNSQMLVANCHKQPQKHFNKYLLGYEEILTTFMGMKESLQEINPDLQIVLTVSPVRHTKETLSLNAASKSVLKLACHYLSDMAENVNYFPSYEIMLDDLRDYRFYEKDLIHPNEQAIDYIWDVFTKTFCTGNTRKTLNEWDKVSRSISHKPFNTKDEKHQRFLHQTLEKLLSLKDRLDVEQEINQVKAQIN
ncbi:MAG: hypothetical protein ACJAVN_000939 [Roseivirga sp.]|jgi:hypothetical protein